MAFIRFSSELIAALSQAGGPKTPRGPSKTKASARAAQEVPAVQNIGGDGRATLFPKPGTLNRKLRHLSLRERTARGCEARRLSKSHELCRKGSSRCLSERQRADHNPNDRKDKFARVLVASTAEALVSVQKPCLVFLIDHLVVEDVKYGLTKSISSRSMVSGDYVAAGQRRVDCRSLLRLPK